MKSHCRKNKHYMTLYAKALNSQLGEARVEWAARGWQEGKAGRAVAPSWQKVAASGRKPMCFVHVVTESWPRLEQSEHTQCGSVHRCYYFHCENENIQRLAAGHGTHS